MNGLLPRLMSLFLAAAIAIGGVSSHAASVLHITPGHGAAGVNADALAAAAPDHGVDVVWAASDCDGAGHGFGGFCFEAQCCAPAVELAAYHVSRPGFEGGKHVIGDPGIYALSVTYSLLKPPRAIA